MLFNLHIEDSLYEELSAAAKSADAVGANMSKFVRDAIKEKIARDVYGVVSVPTAQSIRESVPAAVAGVSNGVTAKPVGDDGLTEGQRRFRELKAQKERAA